MTKSKSFSLSFRLRKKTSKPGYSSIQARISVGEDRVGFSLNRSVRTDLWDNTNRKAKGSSIESKQLNLYLQEIQMNVFSSYDQLRREKKFITAKAVKARFFNEDISELTLLTAFEYHNEEIAHTFALGHSKYGSRSRRKVKLSNKTTKQKSSIEKQQYFYKAVKENSDKIKQKEKEYNLFQFIELSKDLMKIE